MSLHQAKNPLGRAAIPMGSFQGWKHRHSASRPENFDAEGKGEVLEHALTILARFFTRKPGKRRSLDSFEATPLLKN
jgi:hypothetical protein